MTSTEIIIITISLIVASNLIGLVYSCLALYSKLFAKYRIQPKQYKKGILKKRLPLYLLNIGLLLTMSSTSLYFIGDFFETTFPPIWLLIVQVLFVFIIDDAWFYFAHRWMHTNKFLLKHIHSIHHRATTPFPLEYLYVHPFEWMLGIVGTTIGYALIFLVMPVNIYAFWTFALLRNLHEIHIHSDLDVPWLNWIPLVSSTKKHDDHHARLLGNYASTFSIWDRLLKTELKNSNDEK